jgi:hypothetical protein
MLILLVISYLRLFLLLNPNSIGTERLTPEKFGAAGDGTTDDTEAIRKAVLTSKANKAVLFFEGNYLISEPIELEDISIRCSGHFKFVSSHKLKAAFVIKDNVRQTGRWNIEMSDAEGGLGTRTPILIGNYTTGEGYTNISIDSIFVTGGHANMNGVLVTGASKNVSIRHIEAKKSRCGRILNIHWGNSADHYPVNGKYVHKENGKPTTHPSKINVGSVIGEITEDFSDFVALVVVSSGSDVSIKEVTGTIKNNLGRAALVVITAGDLGYGYSAEKRGEMKNIEIGRISGTTNQCGVMFLSEALYRDLDTGNDRGNREFTVPIFCKIGTVDIVSSDNKRKLAAITGSNGQGSVVLGEVTLSNFYDGVSMGNLTSSFRVKRLTAKSIVRNAIWLAGKDENPSLYPQNISFEKVILSASTSRRISEPLLFVQKCRDVSIGTIDLGRHLLSSEVVKVGPVSEKISVSNIYSVRSNSSRFSGNRSVIKKVTYK